MGSLPGRRPTSGKQFMVKDPKRSVLILNNNTAFARRYATRLMHDGYRVLISTVSEAGLRLARLTQPHAIFVDAHVAVGSKTRRVAQRLRRDKATASIPLILTRPNDDSATSRLMTETYGRTFCPK
jgi:response regulator RpfG family c-di-GMP phosphodiesterase